MNGKLDDRHDKPDDPRHQTADSARRSLEGGAALWREVVNDYELPAHALKQLEVACQVLDRLRGAQAALRKDGIIIEGRQGPRPHPPMAIERDTRLAFLRALRELGLDYELPTGQARIAAARDARWRR